MAGNGSIEDPAGLIGELDAGDLPRTGDRVVDIGQIAVVDNTINQHDLSAAFERDVAVHMQAWTNVDFTSVVDRAEKVQWSVKSRDRGLVNERRG